MEDKKIIKGIKIACTILSIMATIGTAWASDKEQKFEIEKAVKKYIEK